MISNLAFQVRFLVELKFTNDKKTSIRRINQKRLGTHPRVLPWHLAQDQRWTYSCLVSSITDGGYKIRQKGQALE